MILPSPVKVVALSPEVKNLWGLQIKTTSNSFIYRDSLRPQNLYRYEIIACTYITDISHGLLDILQASI